MSFIKGSHANKLRDAMEITELSSGSELSSEPLSTVLKVSDGSTDLTASGLDGFAASIAD